MIIRGREYSDEDEYLDERMEYKRESYLKRWPDDNEEKEEEEEER